MPADVSIRACIDDQAHDLVSYEYGKPMIDPVGKVPLYKKVIICKRCARTSDSIRYNRSRKVNQNVAAHA